MQEHYQTIDPEHFPFPVQLYLRPYAEHWRKTVAGDQSIVSEDVVAFIERTIQENPFLMQPISDPGLLEPHHKFLDLLFMHMFPSQELGATLQAISPPFYHKHIIAATPAYYGIFDAMVAVFSDNDGWEYGDPIDYRVLYAYKFLLKKLYDLDLKIDQPITVSLLNPETGLRRYFKLSGNSLFTSVECRNLPEIKRHALQTILDQRFSAEAWQQLIPPENFLLAGISSISLVDITIEESVRRLQYLLLNQRGNEVEWFPKLREEMCNLFRLPGLRLGLATRQANGAMNFSSVHPLWNSLLIKELNQNPGEFSTSEYQNVIDTGQNIIIEDLREHPAGGHPYGRAILEAGYSNLLLSPLIFDNKLIGIMELASPVVGAINGLAMFKIGQIKSVIAYALKLHLEEFENRVEVTMLEEYTAIHPAIRWRFREAAIEIIDNKRNKNNDKQPEILFENVHPFFGTLDVRDSSKKRNAAVERDLIYQLNIARDILKQGYELLGLEILGEHMADLESRLEKARSGFTSGDEIALTEFLRSNVNPVVRHLGQQYPQLNTTCEEYNQCGSADSGICTLNRNAYEAALGLVTRCINVELDAEEEAIQRIYPCYFEKFRTDGVEYNIYAGSAITPGVALDPLYIDNLRLRQLIWTCKIVQKTRALQSEIQSILQAALDQTRLSGQDEGKHSSCIEIAPLIFAYGNTITLKFRSDEKRLDVEGAYNIRYEMLKKRLDKAVIEGTSERLTQPDHLSIVFGGEQDMSAFSRHLKYLTDKGYIESDWQHYTLEPMQGAKGLHAIRARIV